MIKFFTQNQAPDHHQCLHLRARAKPHQFKSNLMIVLMLKGQLRMMLLTKN